MQAQFITAYGKKQKDFGISFPKQGRTKQAHKDETDINLIMAKYIKTGILEHSNNYQAQYGFATSEDLHSSLLIVKKAEQMFNDLPSKARNKFHNQPGEFLDFVQDPENIDQLYDLGLSDNPHIKTSSHDASSMASEDDVTHAIEDFDDSD